MKQSYKSFFYALGLGIISAYSVIHFYPSPVGLTLWLLLIAVVMLFIGKFRENLILFLSCGFAGALVEYYCVQANAWRYSAPSLYLGYLLPLWLPVLWGIAALFIKSTYLAISDKKK